MYIFAKTFQKQTFASIVLLLLHYGGLSQDFDDYSFASFSSPTAGTLESLAITMSSSGTFETDIATSSAVAGILPTGFSNLPARSVLALSETSGTYNTKTISFDANLPSGSFLFIEDLDQSKVLRITFKNSSGTILNPFSNITKYNPTSDAPTAGTSTQTITLTGQAGASAFPIVIFETGSANVRSIELESRDHPSAGDVVNIYLAAPSSAFPVEFLSFDIVEKEELTANIIWETASETNNDYFSIERSVESTINWQEVGTERGRGTYQGISSYSFTDYLPKSGTYYYRLKQTDFDGSYSYSTSKSLRLESSSKIKIYPNPTTASIYLENLQRGVNNINILDVRGKLIQKIKHFSRIEESINIDLTDVKSGIYLIQIGTVYRKIIKI